MRLVLITGTSGAGKTLALHSFEDAGYFTADNMPPRLLQAFIAFCRSEGYERAAVVTDTRSGPSLAELPEALRELDAAGTHVESLFLDAQDDVLVQRYKETRRPHPVIDSPAVHWKSGGILEAIEAERMLLAPLREACERLIDSSALTSAQLRDLLHDTYAADTRPSLLVTITSFGFKHGLPTDADLVFDVRFLANPHYVPELNALDGRDARVAQYVHDDPRTAPLKSRIEELVLFALPEYRSEGKAYLNIAIGCTGGKHRSVVLAQDLLTTLQGAGYDVLVQHRDLPIEALAYAASVHGARDSDVAEDGP